jgi:hypothetical protein
MRVHFGHENQENRMSKLKITTPITDLIPENGFTPTEFYNECQKAKFLRDLCKWIENGMPEKRFLTRKDLYHHLHLHMGHIAHYDKFGFYDVWFSSSTKRIEFIEYHADDRSMGTWGSPAFTFSDVAKVFRIWLRANDIAGQLRTIAYSCV